MVVWVVGRVVSHHFRLRNFAIQMRGVCRVRCALHSRRALMSVVAVPRHMGVVYDGVHVLARLDGKFFRVHN
jgi:hypothetical protein